MDHPIICPGCEATIDLVEVDVLLTLDDPPFLLSTSHLYFRNDRYEAHPGTLRFVENGMGQLMIRCPWCQHKGFTAEICQEPYGLTLRTVLGATHG